MSSSIIKSDNGASSGVTGIVQTAGSDGTLLLQTTTSGGTATTAVTINNTQGVTLASTLSFASSAGTNGIIFNNSSATTNSTLNDYETGTYTPTVTWQTGSASYTSSGTYTKIGNIVNVSVNISITSTGGTGILGATLPFAASTTLIQAGVGAERNSTGKELLAWIDSSNASKVLMRFYDYSDSGLNGYNNCVTISYKATF